MARGDSAIYVKSHVARDLLQNAALFKTDKLCVWEYVANGLQYVDPGTNPVVQVTLESKNKRITVTDNGRGMNWADLQNFFIMHGENVDRKQGRPGRGRFGTGKSAAFGIADVLRIRTVRNMKRSSVELTRAAVQAMSSDDPIPVRVLEQEVPTEERNGTTVEIQGIHLRSIDQAGIIAYIERHLRRWKAGTVLVNNHECESFEPPVAEELIFRPEGQLRGTLGDVELTLKVSKAPLADDDRGVQIYGNGVWHETTLGGSEGRDMSQYIFGEMDVPRLEEDDSPIPPFDFSRSMRLNPSNDLVQAIYAFVGIKVEEVRKRLVEADRERKTTEEARRLAREASEIARIINEDFDAWRHRVARTKARASGGSDLGDVPAAMNDIADELIFGSVVPAQVVAPTGATGHGDGKGGSGTEPPNLGPQVVPGLPDAEKKGGPAGGAHSKSPRGGFSVRFGNMGSESHRAKYVRDERTIYVNLDHPQLSTARGSGSVEDMTFKRLAYEVAFSEYAVALASELAGRGEYLDPSDAIVDIRETLNRVARRSAALYSV